jgi:hypothetical protein
VDLDRRVQNKAMFFQTPCEALVFLQQQKEDVTTKREAIDVNVPEDKKARKKKRQS